jgi:hypothetical protein
MGAIGGSRQGTGEDWHDPSGSVQLPKFRSRRLLGTSWEGKGKGRGTLQTSALPLGYGAVTPELAIYLDFLNPPPGRFPTSFKRLSYRSVTVP